MRTSILIAFAPLFATALSMPGFAQPVGQQDIKIVRTDDLDLSTALGRKRLDHRLVIAAYDVCGAASDADLAGQNAVRKCRHAVLNEVRTQQLPVRIASARRR